MNYIKHLPKDIIFSQEGLDGYSYELNSKNIDIYLEDSHKGHDRYTMNTKSISIYYVIEGKGTFKINEELHDVSKGDIIEIPKNTKFVFKGKMKLLLIMNPPFKEENDITLELNDIY